jgi:hypothetical protein
MLPLQPVEKHQLVCTKGEQERRKDEILKEPPQRQAPTDAVDEFGREVVADSIEDILAQLRIVHCARGKKNKGQRAGKNRTKKIEKIERRKRTGGTR